MERVTGGCARVVRRGFTLIELLVVVAIIALLIAILLPSLGKARERARAVACLSNLKQLGLATYMYQGENNGNFPAAASSSVNAYDWIFWKHGSLDEGALVLYMGGKFNKKVYTCPTDPIADHPTYPYSYTANVNVFIIPNTTTAGIPSAPLKYSAIRNPSKKIVLVDESSTSIDDGAWAPQNFVVDSKNVISNRHVKGSEDKNNLNAGTGAMNFADGHSEILKRSDAMTQDYYDPLY